MNGNNNNGAQQDYGERIYDPRIGRFLSVDPIANQYPMLTPYQFASNRPIDGIDIDGREYGTVYINTYQGKGEAASTYKYTPNDATQTNIEGPLGKGVTYDITTHFKNSNGSTGSENRKTFVARNACFASLFKTDYDNYYGASPLFKVDQYGSMEFNGFDPTLNLEIPAVDAVDQGGKVYDHGYDKLRAVGATPYLVTGEQHQLIKRH